MRRLASILVFCTLPANAAEHGRVGPPDGFFVVTYEIVGRAFDGQTYAGFATLTEEDGALRVTRCIGSAVTSGQLVYDETGHDRVPLLGGSLATGITASCEFDNDINNYARLACYLRPGPRSVETGYGLEIYVIAEDASADGKHACSG